MPEDDESLPPSVPEPPEGWEELQSWLNDQPAHKEEGNFASLDEIERRRRKSKANVHSVLSYCVPVSIAFAFIIFWIGVAIYTWHLFTTESMHWLDANQIKDLHTILFSGAVGAIVAQGAKRYLD